MAGRSRSRKSRSRKSHKKCAGRGSVRVKSHKRKGSHKRVACHMRRKPRRH